MCLNPMDACLHWRLPPQLVFAPDALDFGSLPQNIKAVRELYVYNSAGPIDACSVIGPEEASWVGVLHVQSVHGYEQGCIRIVVEVDTGLLLPGRSHQIWLEVRFGAFCRPVQIAVEVFATRMALLERWHLLQSIAAPVLAVILISSLVSWFLTSGTALSTFFTLLRP